MSVRLDCEIVNRGILQSRAKAKVAILKSLIQLNGKIVDKCSIDVDENDEIILLEQPYKYVSRAGEKLEKAIDSFNLSLDNKLCLDIGASTGGFTHCMLEHNAKKVVAVDVGNNQLDSVLRLNSKVECYENTDIRKFEYNEKFDIITSDVSFISITYIASDIARLLDDAGSAIVLIKPQFECGRQALNKNGVVTSKSDHKKMLIELSQKLSSFNLFIHCADFSPIKGKNGNIEYLFLLKPVFCNVNIDFKLLVENAHKLR